MKTGKKPSKSPPPVDETARRTLQAICTDGTVFSMPGFRCSTAVAEMKLRSELARADMPVVGQDEYGTKLLFVRVLRDGKLVREFDCLLDRYTLELD